jgi:prevent-host-death family protein
MIKTLPITEARNNLTKLVAQVRKVMDEYIITVKGKPAAVLMSSDQYESWKETKEILADKKLMRDIRQGEKDIAEGRFSDWEDVKKELGWGKKDVSTQNLRTSKKKS